MPSHIDFCHLPLACDDSTVVPETLCQSIPAINLQDYLTLHILGLEDPDLQSFSVTLSPTGNKPVFQAWFYCAYLKRSITSVRITWGRLSIGVGNITHNTECRIDSYDCWTICGTGLRLAQ